MKLLQVHGKLPVMMTSKNETIECRTCATETTERYHHDAHRASGTFSKLLVVVLHVTMELKGASESGWGGNHRLPHRSWGQVDKGGGQGLDHAKT